MVVAMRSLSWRGQTCVKLDEGECMLFVLRSLPLVLFVLRCSAAAMLSNIVGKEIGLAYPVWAVISALIISQAKLTEAREATYGRVAGTFLGIVVTVAVGSLMDYMDVTDFSTQMTVVIAVVAAIVFHYQYLKVGMWTCPVVLMSVDEKTHLFQSGMERAAEILVGCVIAIVLHVLFRQVLRMAGLDKGTREPIDQLLNKP